MPGETPATTWTERPGDGCLYRELARPNEQCSCRQGFQPQYFPKSGESEAVCKADFLRTHQPLTSRQANAKIKSTIKSTSMSKSMSKSTSKSTSKSMSESK